MPITTINDIRKQIKPLGFNIRIKSFSYGPHAQWINMATGLVLPTVFSRESLIDWQPLLDWRLQHDAELQALADQSLIYGLRR